jgi:tetratricopeptide (TPR) repeat protein
LGVSPSRYGRDEQRGADPYVARKKDGELDRALREKSFVLVVGDSKAGKSRTAYEAARRLTRTGRPHDPGVLVPKGTAALGPLLDLDPPLEPHPSPALVWLDDLTEGELAGLTADVLDRLVGSTIVLGTITAQRFARIDASDTEIGRSARLALARASMVRLDSELTQTERAAAGAAYPEESFEAGIGEQLVAADQLTARYDNARQGAQPDGWALVQAAIDWVRMDIGRPIRRSELATLYPIYLTLVRPTAEPKQDLTEPLQWARTAVGSRIALLQPVSDASGETCYLPFDYLVAIADGQHDRDPQPIPDHAWEKLPTLTNPTECARAGMSASLRQLPRPAQALFSSVADSGHPGVAPWAMGTLAVLLAEQGDVAGAQSAYQRAIDSGHADAAPKAMVSLGIRLQRQGDVEGARGAFQRAIDSGHADEAPRAMVNLGVLLEELGDVEDARGAFQRAIDSGHADEAPRAMVNLGVLLQRQGDLGGVRPAFQRVIDSGHADEAPRAMVGLGLLLLEQGDPRGARAAFQRVIDSGHAEQAPWAMVGLGLVLEELGDVEGARGAFQRAVDSGHRQARRAAESALTELISPIDKD